MDKLDRMQERQDAIEARRIELSMNSEDDKKVVKSFKIKESVKNKVEVLFAKSGIDKQDQWFEKVLLDYEMRELAKENTNHQRFLTTLDYHLAGISTIFLSVLHTELADKKQIHEQYDADAEQMRFDLEQVKGELKSQLEENKEMSLFADRLKEEAKQRDSTIEQMTGLVNKSDLLINEYKEKNEALSDLVSKQKQAAEQGELHASEARDTKVENEKLRRQLEESEQKIESLKAQHLLEIERIKESKDLEREREKVALQADYQNKLELERNEHSKQLIQAIRKE